MNKRVAVLGVALVFLFALTLSGQEARVQMAKADKKFKPGDTITFVVKLDRPANVDIQFVSIEVHAADQTGIAGSYQASSGGGSRAISKVEHHVFVTLAPHAKAGTWRVTNLGINFQGGSKPLKFEPIEFEVLPGKELVLPDSATVEIAK
jgi:hypothetical protein